MADRASSKVEALSHGNQQRVQLAAALVHDPEVLVLDEPLAGLDPTGIDVIGEVLVEQAHAGRCVLFSSHQLDLVEDLCESVAIIDHGRLVASGTVDELASQGARRLAVRVEGDRQGAWARALPGVTVSEVDGGEVRLDPRRRRRQRRRAGRGARGRPGHPVRLRTPPPVRGLPGGGEPMKALPVIIAALAVVILIRLGLRRDAQFARCHRSAGSRRELRGRKLFGETGLVAGREIRERLRGRMFRVVTVILFAVVAAAVVIPTIHSGTTQSQRVGVVASFSIT